MATEKAMGICLYDYETGKLRAITVSCGSTVPEFIDQYNTYDKVSALIDQGHAAWLDETIEKSSFYARDHGECLSMIEQSLDDMYWANRAMVNDMRANEIDEVWFISSHGLKFGKAWRCDFIDRIGYFCNNVSN